MNSSKVFEGSGVAGWVVACSILIVAITSIAYSLFRHRLDPLSNWNGYLRAIQIIAFIIIAILLTPSEKTITILALYIWAMVLAVVLLSERKVLQNTKLQLQEDGISIPGYFVKHQVPWNTVDDLVLRPDYITIFRSNKKFMQLELLEDVAPAEIQQINSFSQEQISKAVKE